MQKIKIITDSTSDITKEEEKRLGIKVMCFPITVDGESYRERIDFTNEQFYRMMDNAKEMPKTSQLTSFEILEVFRGLHEEGWTDVIYVTISSTGSATYSNALSAAEEFKRETADTEDKVMRIHIVDSKNYTAVYGYPVLQAALKAQKGEPPEEIIDYLKEWFDTAEVHFMPMTLKYAKKSGRISSVAAFAGELLGMKPIIKIANGVSTVMEKVRGEKNIIPKLLEDAERNMLPQTPYIMVEGSDPTLTDALQEKMTERFGYPPVYRVQIGAAVACNAGHNVVGFIIKGRKKS
ncbi:MAG: DegV family protein [Clostridium sp.]|nr:DegV family protein [Clostridium sp.]MCM1546789.1 DegV family protein [Ruminococcus sp.]